MKTTYKLLSLAVVSLLILAACGKAPESGTSVVPTDVMVKDGVAEDEAPAVAKSSGTLFDKKVACSMLKTAAQKEDCEFQVNEFIAQIIQGEAVQTFDLGLCGKLPSFFEEQCKTVVEASGVKGPVLEADIAKYYEALSLVFSADGVDSGPAVPTYDKSKCAELQTPGYRAYCEGQIDLRMGRVQLDKVFENGKAGDCEQFTNEDLKADCEGYFGIVREQPGEESEEVVE